MWNSNTVPVIRTCVGKYGMRGVTETRLSTSVDTNLPLSTVNDLLYVWRPPSIVLRSDSELRRATVFDVTDKLPSVATISIVAADNALLLSTTPATSVLMLSNGKLGSSYCGRSSVRGYVFQGKLRISTAAVLLCYVASGDRGRTRSCQLPLRHQPSRSPIHQFEV